MSKLSEALITVPIVADPRYSALPIEVDLSAGNVLLNEQQSRAAKITLVGATQARRVQFADVDAGTCRVVNRTNYPITLHRPGAGVGVVLAANDTIEVNL